jgi:hypothetical protein
LGGVTKGNYPVDFALELSGLYTNLLFEVWGDRLCLSEGWWVVFAGHEHCLVYSGEELVRDGQVVADASFYDDGKKNILPCPFGGVSGW